MTPIDEAALKADPSDSEIMEIAGRWFHTGENQHRADGYYYRSLGTPTNVRGSDLIEFARALLHRSQPVAVVPAEQAEDSAMLDWLDSMNRALNDFHGTKYGWKVVLSRHVTRVISERKSHGCIADIDVDDSHAHAPNSIRAAIRAAMSNREAGGS